MKIESIKKRIQQSICIVKYVGILYVTIGYSQERSTYNLYNHYQPIINPAAMGSYDYLNVALLFNHQMAGFDGAPLHGLIDVTAPLGKSNAIIGGQYSIDKIGNRLYNYVNVNFAYRVRLNLKHYLSFGISAGMQNLNIDYSQLTITNPDPSIINQQVNQFAPDFKLGAYYFTDNLYIGFSTNNLIKLRPNDPVINVNINDIQFMLHGGYRIRMGELWSLTPSILLKQIAGSPLQIDVNLNALYNQVFGFGLSYRTLNTLLVQLHVKIAKQWFMGYGYNMGLGFRDNLFYHGHEVMLMYQGMNTKKKLPVSCPRF
jgi:type IX secretion system PorP/SprF family membrane protein